MKNNRRLSPFEELVRAIENEIYIFGLDYKLHPEKYTSDFAIGYVTALRAVEEKANEIYRRQ